MMLTVEDSMGSVMYVKFNGSGSSSTYEKIYAITTRPLKTMKTQMMVFSK